MSASSRRERAFDVYLSLGPDRSLAELAAALRADPHRAGLRRAPSLRTLEGWSAGRKWQDRIADVDRQAGEEAERQHLAWVSEHRERGPTGGTPPSTARHRVAQGKGWR